MEITVYALFTIFCYLMYFIVYAKKDVLGDIDQVLLKLMMGISFMCLALFSMSIEYDLPNGSPASFTPVSEDLITNMWQRGLFLFYMLFGLMQLVWAGLDGKELSRKQKLIREEELENGD